MYRLRVVEDLRWNSFSLVRTNLPWPQHSSGHRESLDFKGRLNDRYRIMIFNYLSQWVYSLEYIYHLLAQSNICVNRKTLHSVRFRMSASLSTLSIFRQCHPLSIFRQYLLFLDNTALWESTAIRKGQQRFYHTIMISAMHWCLCDNTQPCSEVVSAGIIFLFVFSSATIAHSTRWLSMWHVR